MPKPRTIGTSIGRRNSIAGLLATLTSDHPVARQAARRALVALGPEATKPLASLLTDRRALVRWEAAKALGETADPQAIFPLIDALEDRDAGIRWLAAVGLIRIGRPALPALLAAVLDRPKSEELREGAHHVLHDLSRQEPSPLLKRVLRALRRPEWELAVPQTLHETLEYLRATDRASR